MKPWWTDAEALECELRWQAEHWGQAEERHQKARAGALRMPYPERRLVYLMDAGRTEEAISEAAGILRKEESSGRGPHPRRLVNRSGG
jgi:hypothetical protein